MKVDNSELRAFIADIESKIKATPKQVEKIVHRGANNIKRQHRAEMEASSHFKGAASAISYDIRSGGAFGGGFIEAEIGPVKGKPGSLANIAYFGTSRGGGTVADPQNALDDEAPRFADALADWIGEI